MKNDYREHPEYILLYLFSLLFLISLVDSPILLGSITGGILIYYYFNFKDFKFYELVYPVLPFIILMILPSLFSFIIRREFQIPGYAGMIIVKVLLSALTLGSVLKKYSSLYMVEGILNIGFPSVLNRILALTFRYFYMIYGDVLIGQDALYSRGLKNRGLLASFKIWGEWIGGFFLKSADHSEKIYHAMKARGFTGESRGSFFERKDLCLRLGLITVGLVIIMKVF